VSNASLDSNYFTSMARDKHYPNRTIRLSDEVWEQLKVAQKQSGKNWNQFIKELTNGP
jgi:hypothetical protein